MMISYLTIVWVQKFCNDINSTETISKQCGFGKKSNKIRIYMEPEKELKAEGHNYMEANATE